MSTTICNVLLLPSFMELLGLELPELRGESMPLYELSVDHWLRALLGPSLSPPRLSFAESESSNSPVPNTSRGMTVLIVKSTYWAKCTCARTARDDAERSGGSALP